MRQPSKHGASIPPWPAAGVIMASAVLLNLALENRGWAAFSLENLFYCAWAFSLLAVVLNNALVTSEDRKLREELLKVAPGRGQELLQGRLREARRFVIIIMSLLFVLLFFWYWGRVYDWICPNFGFNSARGACVLLAFAQLLASSWGSVWIGMGVRSRSDAVALVIGAIVLWQLLSGGGAFTIQNISFIRFNYPLPETRFALFMVAGPVVSTLYLGAGVISPRCPCLSPDTIALIGLVQYGVVWYVFRTLCFYKLDHLRAPDFENLPQPSAETGERKAEGGIEDFRSAIREWGHMPARPAITAPLPCAGGAVGKTKSERSVPAVARRAAPRPPPAEEFVFRMPFRGGCPLLFKELLEQAARKRTYLLRVAYIAFMFICFTVAFLSHPLIRQAGGADIKTALGAGTAVFSALVNIQFAGIFIILPALMAGVLTVEKERGSLSLLLITDMGPWEIILQKYFGRLIPMLACLLLSLPLFAFAYSLGGIAAERLIMGALLLLLACLHVGAFALMCSSYCQTTMGALLASYLLGALYCRLPALCFIALALFGLRELRLSTRRGSHWSYILLVAFFIIGMIQIMVFARQQFWPPALFVIFSRIDSVPTFVYGRLLAEFLPIMMSTVFFLFMSRVFFFRHAYVQPQKNLLLRVFEHLDTYFEGLNKGFGSIKLLQRRDDSLPGDSPVAWREVSKKALGQVHYLFRIFVPVAFVLTFIVMDDSKGGGGVNCARYVCAAVWLLAVAVLSFKGANLIASERVGQTLEVLLTSPMSGGEILRQKMRGTMLVTLILAAALVSLLLVKAYLERLSPTTLVLSCLALVYLPMFTWFSVWIGLRARTGARAIATALVAALLWLALPVALGFAVTLFKGNGLSGWTTDFLLLILKLSPAAGVDLAGFWFPGMALKELPPALLAGNFMLHAALWGLFRTLSLRDADHYLRKTG